MDDPTPPVSAEFTADLVRWSEALSAIARTGMGFTQSLYERERYEEVLHIAGDMLSVAEDALELRRESDHFVQEWIDSVSHGVTGYVTPKCAIGAIVGDDQGRMLMIQRSDSGMWLYPTGWADVGYSPAEVVMKEVKEETGIECEPVRLIAVLDGMRMGFTRIPMYSLVFHCRATGGTLDPHPLETLGAAWFHEHEVPMPFAAAGRLMDHAFSAIRGEHVEVLFDQPRMPVWRESRRDALHRAAQAEDADGG